MPQSAIDRVARAFAPGHLGELSALVPVELVDEVLARHRATEQRVRLLPSRVVVYLLVAGALFAGLGWQQVWDRLVAGLGHVDSCPSRTAIALALRRVGPGPLRSLFEVLACPAPGSTRWRGLLVCALDGTVTSVPDSPANTIRYVKQRGGPTGGGSYPGLRLVALVACGTRTLIDATFGPTTTGETVYAQVLTRSLHAGMLLLADRGLSSAALVAAAHARGAHVLVRARTAAANGPALPVTRALDDGSWLSMLGATRVRVIDAQITSATTAATTTSHYRLVTTLLDPRTHPADQLAGLYHQRWQVETAYLELKSTILGGRVLRARTPDGIEQEVYALLIAYQALRTAMADATTTTAIPPDRASFTIALNAARDQITANRHADATDPPIELLGVIGAAVTARPLPATRPRTNARTVKRAISKYNARGPNIDRKTYKTTLTITILTKPTPT
ncbi:IS4 family transposase [Xylanimonas protaetiae]|uniref:IS4 family transposase n=1 Tax=Xylanimonas protaetiae TaxID=2509457 RepID=A0A4P6F2M2_9MICO|nr:IS4 family transposase [Xylanimonas protaetiae]QAY69754.1 IS4 family transposase [Xylanimonas protaetiae]